MTTSQTVAEVAAALAIAEMNIENPSADATNPYFNSRYAKLAVVLSTIRKAFGPVGLAMVQTPATRRDEATGKLFLSVPTRVQHKSGEFIEFEGPEVEVVRRAKKRNASDAEDPVVAGPATAQDEAAAVTYLRRINAMSITGIAGDDDDDDGNEASGNGHAAPARAPVAGPVAKELAEGASERELYAGCMMMLSEVVTVAGERMPVLTPEARAHYKGAADGAKGDAAKLLAVYKELREAVRARKEAMPI